MSESAAPRAYSYAPDRIARYCLYPDNRFLRRLLAANVLNMIARGCERDERDLMSFPRDLPAWKIGLEIVIHSMQHPFPTEDFEGYEEDAETARDAAAERLNESMRFWMEQVKGVRPYRLAVQWLPAIVDVTKAIQAYALLWTLHRYELIKHEEPMLDHLDTLVSTVARFGLDADEVDQALSDAGMMATWFLAVQLELSASVLDQPEAILSAVLEAAKIEVQNGEQLRPDA